MTAAMTGQESDFAAADLTDDKSVGRFAFRGALLAYIAPLPFSFGAGPDRDMF